MEVDGDICVCQLTDIHLRKEEHAVIMGCDTTASFEAVLREVNKLHDFDEPDLFLLTGDVSDQPSIDAYENVLSRLSVLDKPKYFLPGNHDDPELMGAMKGMDTSNIISRGKWNIILLSSHIPSSDGGELMQPEMDHLIRCLEETKSQGKYALVSLHHPPVSIGSAWMDCIGLSNQEEFFRILDLYEAQVRCVVWGHIHQEFESKHRNIKLLGSPSTCFQFKPRQENFILDDENPHPGFRLLHLRDDGEVSTEVKRVILSVQ